MEEADEFERQEEQEAEAAEVRIDEDEEGAAPTEGRRGISHRQHKRAKSAAGSRTGSPRV